MFWRRLYVHDAEAESTELTINPRFYSLRSLFGPQNRLLLTPYAQSPPCFYYFLVSSTPDL